MSYQAPQHGFRTFVIVWASQSVSVFGSALTLFALNIWLVQSVYPLPGQQRELAWALAAVGLSMGLPAVAATPLAGALADRWDRRRIMLFTDLMNGALMTVVAVLMATGTLRLWTMLSILVLLAITSAMHASAFDASYAMLVSDDQLPRANGMMQTMWSLSSVFSPMIAATIIALPVLARQGHLPGALGTLLGAVKEGAALAISLDAVTFFLAAAVLAGVAIPSPHRADLGQGGGKRTSIWADVWFGVTYIWRRRPLLWLLLTFAVVNLCLPLGVFLPLLVKISLAADWTARGFTYETALAAVNFIMAAGGVAGGGLISLWGGLKRRRVIALMLGILVTGLAQLVLGLGATLYVAAAGGFLLSFMGPVVNSHSQAIWQAQVPREAQGRVFAVRRVMSLALGPLGQVVAGWMAGRMNPGTGLAVLGAVIAAVGLVQLCNPQTLRVEDTAYLEQLARQAEAG